jgi:hypothetical protein
MSAQFTFKIYGRSDATEAQRALHLPHDEIVHLRDMHYEGWREARLDGPESSTLYGIWVRDEAARLAALAALPPSSRASIRITEMHI